MTPPPLAVSTGDPGGVGPEVALRAAERFPDERLLLFGDAAALARMAGRFGIEAGRVELGARSRQRIGLVDCAAVWDGEAGLHRATVAGGTAQLLALEAARVAVVDGHARALVTAPMAKLAVTRAGHQFSGHTEYLARASGLADDDVTMLFLGPRLRVGLVTTHVAIGDLPGLITAERVARTCRHLGEALQALGGGRDDGGVVVTGLNPHAGEGGMFGDEEAVAITPGVRLAAASSPYGEGGLGLEGPQAAETALRRAAAGEVAGVVAMAHDQATIASKLLDWGEAVNVTWGLPYVRTSVDHGVAYDAAEAGEVDSSGMLAALRMARQLTAR